MICHDLITWMGYPHGSGNLYIGFHVSSCKLFWCATSGNSTHELLLSPSSVLEVPPRMGSAQINKTSNARVGFAQTWWNYSNSWPFSSIFPWMPLQEDQEPHFLIFSVHFGFIDLSLEDSSEFGFRSSSLPLKPPAIR